MKAPVEPIDPFANLGHPVPKAPSPASAPTPVGNGVYRNPDGKLETHIPPPPLPWDPA